MKIGQLCIKSAGRDKDKECVIVEIIKDTNFVIVDGKTRRRKCNIKHLNPMPNEIKIKQGALHEEVARALNEEGIKVNIKKTIVKKEKQKNAKQ